MTENRQIPVKVLAEIKSVLDKELAVVMFEPQLSYSLDYLQYTPQEYKQLLFRLRETVREALENDPFANEPSVMRFGASQIPDDEPDYPEYADQDARHGNVRQAYRLTFYIIPDGSNPDVTSEMILYYTPYLYSKVDCITYVCNRTRLALVTWELLHYAEKCILREYKQIYLDKAYSEYGEVTLNILKWLQTGLENPEALFTDEGSEYEGHQMISEPKYDIRVYGRFDEADVIH